MDNFGEQLRRERERRNVSLDEIARSTKIRVRYLQALEDGQHERLPGIVFAKGYVRAYAETIGADADRLVDAYVEEQRSQGRLGSEASQENVLEALAAAVDRKAAPTSKRGVILLVVAASAVAVLALFWFGLPSLLTRDPAAAAAESRPADVRTPSPPPVDAVATDPSSEPASVAGEGSDTGDDLAPAVEPEPDAVFAPLTSSVPAEETTPPAAREIEPPDPPATTRSTSPAPQAAGATLSVPDHGVGTGVEQRTLVGEASEFPTGTKAAFWTRVLGGRPGEVIRHVWMHEGRVTSSIELTIGGSHWRTYSTQTLRRPGRWSVEARDARGRVLASRTFAASDGNR